MNSYGIMQAMEPLEKGLFDEKLPRRISGANCETCNGTGYFAGVCTDCKGSGNE